MMADDGRDDIVHGGKVADDFHRRFHVALHDFIFLCRKLSCLVQYVLRNPNLADVMEQRRFLKYFPVFLAGVEGPSNGLCVICHILGMLECIMVLGVNGSCQGIDGGSVF